MKVQFINYRIVIPVHNPSKNLLKVLTKLEATNPGTVERVRLIDDGSTNGIPQEIESKFPQIKRIQGDGTLWWCGAIKLGMQYALEENPDVIVWLNHDCLPAAGSLEKLVLLASQTGNGAVSAWCRSWDSPEFPVNPGFRNYTEIPVEELYATDTLEVDGVNGNCVAINAKAIQSVGLPDAKKHPHYGDGPYTYRLHKAGFRNLVCTKALAFLEREYNRCISVSWRCAFWNASLASKFNYYLFSNKSKFHWSIKYNDIIVFRGNLLAPFVYVASMINLCREIILGHFLFRCVTREKRLRALLRQYTTKFPVEGLIQSLNQIEDVRN